MNTAFQEMAVIVDEQNKRGPHYMTMAPKYNCYAFKASKALVFEGVEQANGYTEDILIKYRRKFLEADQLK